MRKAVILVMTNIFCTASLLSHATGDNSVSLMMDFSGVEAFLNLTEKVEITESAISTMLRLPAYRRMIDSIPCNEQDVADIYASALTRNAPQLKQHLQHPFVSLMVKDLQFARDNRPRIRRFLEEIRQNWEPTSTIRLVHRYLPGNCTAKEVRITFVVGLAQGVQTGDELLIDFPLSLMLKPETPVERLIRGIAHELHHLWGSSLDAEAHSEEERYQGIVWALTQLEKEGIAMTLEWDGLDAHEAIKREADRMIQFFGEPARELLNVVLSVYEGGHVVYLSRLDEAMSNVLNGEVRGKQAVEHVTSVLHSNVDHPIGHEMALLIQAELGRQALIVCVNKPYQFLKAYQKAAKSIGNPSVAYVFDDELIQAIGSRVFSRELPETPELLDK